MIGVIFTSLAALLFSWAAVLFIDEFLPQDWRDEQ